MTKKIYISPSDQTENRYAWGNTNEHAQCQRIAEAEAAALRRSGFFAHGAAKPRLCAAHSRGASPYYCSKCW